MTKIVRVLVILLIYLIIAIAVILYLWCYTVFSDWLALFALVFSGVIVVERIAQWLSQIGEEPSLKVTGFTTKRYSEDSDGEYMEIFLKIKNTGGGKADDCEVKAMVKDVLTDYYQISGSPFLLIPDDTTKILFQQILKGEQTTRSINDVSPRLSRGKIYTFKIRFLGSNFKDKKLHTLKLDLSSWENIKVILDC